MPICYFTYSWEKNERKEQQVSYLLSYIKQRIEILSDYDISAVFDKESFKEGEDFRKREKQIAESDCVLLFFTPAYKEKILSKSDSGAKREYQLIKERALSGEGGVMPILLSGNRETAVPNEFQNIIYWDLSKFRDPIYKTNKKFVVGDALQEYVDKLAKKAIREAYVMSFCRKPEFSSMDEEYQALFLDSAANAPLPPNCIIKMNAHDRIIHQDVCFVIGRKGSGKSTLLSTIQRYDPSFFYNHYKKLACIDAESLDISFIYNNLIDKVRQDLDVLSMQKILDTFWEIVFVFQSIVTIGLELEYFEITKEDNRYETFKEVTQKLKDLLGISSDRFKSGLPHSSICNCAVELVERHIRLNVLDKANELTPLTGATSNIDSFIILNDIFGVELFHQYCLGVRQCKKKILLALDGFDTHSEDFRFTTNRLANNNKEEYQFRTDFEIRLFRELMVVVSNIKRKRVKLEKQYFFTAVHFCVILPQDRYDQIALDDRDIEKRDICSLNWDAYELMEMLVKRLEYHFKVDLSAKRLSLEDRFYSILQEKMPHIPMQMNIVVNGYPQRMSLFNYLLRHTFWRPRDIIKNFAIIMKLSKDNEIEAKDPQLIQSIIKKALAHGVSRIIEGEFINEYKNVYVNIKDVLLHFRTNDFVQDFDVFCEKLSKIEVRTTKISTEFDVESKLRLLYRLGVIGFYTNKDDDNLWNGFPYCYSFTEGLDPMDEILVQGLPIKSAPKIVFNPIFIRYLLLNVNINEQICDYPWEYIETNHQLKDNIRRP